MASVKSVFIPVGVEIVEIKGLKIATSIYLDVSKVIVLFNKRSVGKTKLSDNANKVGYIQ